MTYGVIFNEYFDWLYELVCKDKFGKDISYKKLLTRLHNTEFRYSLSRDQNRADDGTDLRYRFAVTQGYEHMADEIANILDELGPCSVLEMMIALSLRCEENIMDDPRMGNRTSQWFWEMIVSLGLGSMSDTMFDGHFVNDIIERFLNREYEPNGKGGLFTIRNFNGDLRTVEIWYQLCWYLDSIM